MRCQCNKIRLAPAPWANELTIGQALASVGAPHSACPSGFLPPRSRSPRYCVSDVQHLMGEVPQIRIDALPQRFRIFVGSLAHGSPTAAMQLQRAYGSGALDEGPVPKLAGRPLQLDLRVHHDRRRVPEAVFLRRAETGFLLLGPGPLPRRYCRRERAALAAVVDFQPGATSAARWRGRSLSLCGEMAGNPIDAASVG